jgi:hypothetical protein
MEMESELPAAICAACLPLQSKQSCLNPSSDMCLPALRRACLCVCVYVCAEFVPSSPMSDTSSHRGRSADSVTPSGVKVAAPTAAVLAPPAQQAAQQKQAQQQPSADGIMPGANGGIPQDQKQQQPGEPLAAALASAVAAAAAAAGQQPAPAPASSHIEGF